MLKRTGEMGVRRDLGRAARGADLVLGAALLVDAAWALVRNRHPGALWLDLSWTSAPYALLLSAGLGLALVLGASWRRARLAAVFGAALVALHALRDAVVCAPHTGLQSFSALLMLVAIGLAWAATQELREVLPPPRASLRHAALFALGAAAMTFYLPLSQIAGSAAVDYARPADAVVVLGARVYRDGQPSLALWDRTRTGCELIQRGYASKLIVSGGPGDGDLDEPEAMRQIALACGVPNTAIELDHEGLSTGRSAANIAQRLARSDRSPRVLVVSHDYHLARVRMAFHDAGVTALTVPAQETRPLTKLPWFVLREVPAFWVYFLSKGRLGR